MNVRTEPSSRLFIIPHGDHFSTLGWDVCEWRITKYAAELGLERPKTELGTLQAYEVLQALVEAARLRYETTKEQLKADLTPALIGLEGKRVEVQYPSGEKKRFWVGKSGGWIPIHLEIANTRSTGGMPVYWPEGTKVVKIVRDRR